MVDFTSLFSKLSNSKFRSRFKLKGTDVSFIAERGMDKIEMHARDFITEKLFDAKEVEDNEEQIPTKGHPVFAAMHATAICCRGCMSRWHGIPQKREMTPFEVEYCVNVVKAWINREIENGEVVWTAPAQLSLFPLEELPKEKRRVRPRKQIKIESEQLSLFGA